MSVQVQLRTSLDADCAQFDKNRLNYRHYIFYKNVKQKKPCIAARSLLKKNIFNPDRSS